MLDRRKLRILIFSWVFLALVFAVGALLYFEQQYCMDVLLISEDKAGQYTSVRALDITQLRFNGEKIAADVAQNTIYISQAADQLAHYSSLEGRLDSANPNHALFLVKNAALDDLSSAVSSGSPLTLLITEGNTCQKVNVVITTLPVLNMEGAVTHQDQEGRAVFSGSAALWSGFDPATGAYSTTSSDLQWHVRGNTTAAEPKKSWKLSFKNKHADNKDLNLLGLGEDDDWILNSLTMDDTRLKEKLFMDLWNTIAGESDHNYKMSTGEYVEVVINGEYVGLYLLQRRLDAKYLELSGEDVLLKATYYQAGSVEEAYEFVSPKVNTKKIYAIMQGVYDGTDASGYNLHNVIDVNLMLQMASARDNYSLKNMYHVLKKTDQGYTQYLVPWDTDQSFGVVWKTDIGFCYDYAQSLREFTERMETAFLRQAYPDYSQIATERWNDLRRTTLTEDRILSHIDELYDRLCNSGGFARDVWKWSNRYGGDDSVSAIKDFILARLTFMDEHYRETLENTP